MPINGTAGLPPQIAQMLEQQGTAVPQTQTPAPSSIYGAPLPPPDKLTENHTHQTINLALVFLSQIMQQQQMPTYQKVAFMTQITQSISSLASLINQDGNKEDPAVKQQEMQLKQQEAEQKMVIQQQLADQKIKLEEMKLQFEEYKLDRQLEMETKKQEQQLQIDQQKASIDNAAQVQNLEHQEEAHQQNTSQQAEQHKQNLSQQAQQHKQQQQQAKDKEN